ncbi:MAG: ribonuclease R [Lachnospiraceae bacterium]|jgi:ribonuclease R|nr:ribonuclease R [Lachnospiraceae bacterium]
MRRQDSTNTAMIKIVSMRKEKIIGTYLANAKGFGFVKVPENGRDYYVPAGMEADALHKDTVEIVLLENQRSDRTVAKVVCVLARGITQVVGTFYLSGRKYGYVIPDNDKVGTDIYVPIQYSRNAQDGQKVVVKITDYGSADRNPTGDISEILGEATQPGVDVLSIVYEMGIPVSFPSKVQKQALRVASEVTPKDREGRRDLRDTFMVTIDGEDAKDLDDAVSISFEDGCYCLGVHIADVTNYVQENSALDWEAKNRGTSIYLPDRVIPMLPRTLSNGICSLNEGEDRLALSCFMKIDEMGDRIDYEICESVICVNRRMTYTAVETLITSQELEEADADSELVFHLRQMKQLSALLRKKRKKRGAIDFDFPEAKVIVDDDGHPTDIVVRKRNTATDIIEDFMLAANETIAMHFFRLDIPFVYRIHELPDEEKIEKLSTLTQKFGVILKKTSRKISPKEIQRVLRKVDGKPEEAMISRLALRSMKQAKYSTLCVGHFGLSCKEYCHFTSPIRRYPDLQIHRIVKEHLRQKLSDERIAHYRDILPQVALSSSENERRADEAQREVTKRKKAEYMDAHIGEEFEGQISGVTAWGIYVELANTVEGLVPIANLPGDNYLFHEEDYAMVGETTNQRFTLGMLVRIRVTRCDKERGVIYFTIAEEP